MCMYVCDVTGARRIINNGHRGMSVRPTKQGVYRRVRIIGDIYCVLSVRFIPAATGSGRVDDDSAAAEKSPENSTGNLYSLRCAGVLCTGSSGVYTGLRLLDGVSRKGQLKAD